MKVVGLLSGGKDSVFNLLHCVLNGHEPIALASLGPPSGQDELDSYMYQTVGHSGLHSIALALGLPLLTHTISGKPLNLESSYGTRVGTAQIEKGGEKGTAGDETEDLFQLLSKVKEAVPEVQGVACGAILSNYQRVRVEHVCSRLGLTPIAYLWERNQRELLGEMVQAEMNSVLVKVAGAGLEVDHLGKSLAEMEPTLHRLNERYELHVCGEGGEYETFTLDCPLFKQRIVLSKTTTVISNSDPFSTVAHLHLDECTLEEKVGHPLEETFEQTRERIRGMVGVPPLLEEKAGEALLAVKTQYSLSQLPAEAQVGVHPIVPSGWIEPSAKRVGNWLSFAEVSALCSDNSSADLSLDDEVKACFANLQTLLTKHDATLLDVSHLTVYLAPSAMSLFPSINASYATYFGTAPPTRACVAVLLPSDQNIRLKLDGSAYLDREAPRKSLHVQSLSYWAAANIGPYSQAVTTGERSFIAGQIALVPRSLTLPDPFDFCTEAVLSLQHVARVVEAAREGRWEGWTEGGVCWLAEVGSKDEWDRRRSAAEVAWAHFLEDYDQPYAPMVYVSAAALPKGASIEWQVSWTSASPPAPRGDTDSEDEDTPARAPLGRETGGESEEGGARWMCATSRGVATTVNAFYVCSSTSQGKAKELVSLGAIHSIRAFHLSHLGAEQVETIARKVLGVGKGEEEGPAFSTVAVSRLSAGGERQAGEVAFWLTLSTE